VRYVLEGSERVRECVRRCGVEEPDSQSRPRLFLGCPPGCAKFVITPRRTGSIPIGNTMGMTDVVCFAVGVPFVTMTSHAPEKHDDYQVAINDDYGSFLML
jgi:hypothetical protein